MGPNLLQIPRNMKAVQFADSHTVSYTLADLELRSMFVLVDLTFRWGTAVLCSLNLNPGHDGILVLLPFQTSHGIAIRYSTA